MFYDENMNKERFVYPDPARERAEIENYQAETAARDKIKNAKERKQEESRIEGLVDKMSAAIMVENAKRKLEAEPPEEIPEALAAHHLLSGLRTNIIDRLLKLERGKSADDKEWRKTHEEIMRKVREAVSDHYQTFYFAGAVHRLEDQEGRDRYELGKPLGASYEIQRIMIEQARFTIARKKIKFFEAGREDEIPGADLKNALKVYVNDWERDLYEKEHSRRISAGTTWILFETLWKGGFFDYLRPKEKGEMMALAMFADIIEKGEWLPFSSGTFFKGEVNLFTLSRKLSGEQFKKIFNEFLTGETDIASYDFKAMAGRIQEIVVRKGSAPLSGEFIKKNKLEYLVRGQEYEVEKTKEYLSSDFNSFDSRFGRIIFSRGFSEKLPGQLPAIAAEPPRKNGKPMWKKVNGYFEANKAHLLGYLRKSDFEKILGAVTAEAEGKGLRPQVNDIDGWTKLFISLKGNYDADLVRTMKDRWLKISTQERRMSPQKTLHLGERKKEQEKKIAA